MSETDKRIDIEVMEAAARKATPGPRSVNRYEHGGGRIFIEEEPRCLIADLYQEGDREYFALMTPGKAITLCEELRETRNALDARDAEVRELRKALERELAGAKRAAIESEKQQRPDWARHFARMQDRISSALMGVKGP